MIPTWPDFRVCMQEKCRPSIRSAVFAKCALIKDAFVSIAADLISLEGGGSLNRV